MIITPSLKILIIILPNQKPTVDNSIKKCLLSVYTRMHKPPPLVTAFIEKNEMFWNPGGVAVSYGTYIAALKYREISAVCFQKHLKNLGVNL